MANIQQCRSCGADVIWLKNDRTGKPAPIDATPSEHGNILVGETQGIYGVINPVELNDYRDAMPGKLHTNHFMTCPSAARWKKGGQK